MAVSVEPRILLAEIERLVQSAPPAHEFYYDVPERHAWLGDVSAALHSWDTVRSVGAIMAVDRVFNNVMRNNSERQVITVALMTARRSLQLGLGVTSATYIDPPAGKRDEIKSELRALREAVVASNTIEPENREIVLAEIAVFEATLLQPRLSSELIQRFVSSVLKGAMMKLAGASADEIAGRIITLALALIAAAATS